MSFNLITSIFWIAIIAVVIVYLVATYKHGKKMKWLSHRQIYLDRGFIAPEASKRTIKDLGYGYQHWANEQ